MKRKLVRRKAKQSMQEFLAELRARAAEGYSARQLMKSHIPDIGSEAKIPEAEVTAALAKREVAIAGGCHYLGSDFLSN